jgi:hypothetical protein
MRCSIRDQRCRITTPVCTVEGAKCILASPYTISAQREARNQSNQLTMASVATEEAERLACYHGRGTKSRTKKNWWVSHKETGKIKSTLPMITASVLNTVHRCERKNHHSPGALPQLSRKRKRCELCKDRT